jgi:8-oxo-dGTP pyrophosphatase MutT (NUDIX family)
MNHIICDLELRGFDKITLFSSPYGLPFYLQYGFTPTDVEQHSDGFIFTPMAYEPNEIWDVLDENGNKTGRYAERGRKMATGDYFLIVHVWKHNGKGEWLIDRRAPRYGRGDIDGKWETTGGCAVAGDNSLTAALREAKEELGIDLDTEKGILFNRFNRRGDNGHTWFEDVWVFEYDESLESVAFDGSEVCDVMWATVEKIREMTAMGEFLGEAVYPYFDEMVEKWRVAE